MLTMDLVAALVLGVIGQVVSMVVGVVLTVAMEVNLVGMDMLVPWGPIEETLHLGTPVGMVVALTEVMISVAMVELVKITGDMVVLVVLLVVPMGVAMMAA